MIFRLLQKQHLCAVFVFLICGLSPLSFPALADTIHQPTIAIIIDDMGNQYQNGLDLIKIPYPLTLSFLPERPHTLELTERATKNKKEVMLHSPMENILGLELGIGGLRETMTKQEIKRTLADSFKAVPHMIGINNHMGSKLTTRPEIMKWVMEEVQKYPFYFVDSRTSANSVAAETARTFKIPTLNRDVFLDHRQTRKFIQQQFLKLINIARTKGSAIAIAHPHKVTVDYLKWALPKLDEKGISIATVSALWRIRNPQQKMYAHRKLLPREWVSSSR